MESKEVNTADNLRLEISARIKLSKNSLKQKSKDDWGEQGGAR